MYLFNYRITNSLFNSLRENVSFVYLSLRIFKSSLVMKRLNVTVMVLFSLQLFAQESTTSKAISNIVQKEDKFILNFTSDNWGKLSSDIVSKPFRSHGFSFLFMDDRMNKTGNLGFGAGIGFMSQNVHTNGYFVDTTSDESAYIFGKIPDNLDYKVNKLSLNFITAALEIRIRSNENKRRERFKFSFGITAGILIQSHTKYEDKNGKIKLYNVEHLNNFQYGVHGRLGYSNYAINGYYSLVDVFEKGNGPELIPYSIGISFTF